MFTGIVDEVGTVSSIGQGKLAISSGKVISALELGSSVSVNGVCLTVTGFASGVFTVDVMPETMQRSNIGLLTTGDSVNLEKSLAFGGPMGGHLVQGHIDATGSLASFRRDGEAVIMRFDAPPEVMRYIVEKGFIAVDGVSLTVMERGEDSFQVSVVNFSRRNTVLGSRRVGDRVNLEVDIIAKYVEQFSKPRREAITESFLQQHGFTSR